MLCLAFLASGCSGLAAPAQGMALQALPSPEAALRPAPSETPASALPTVTVLPVTAETAAADVPPTLAVTTPLPPDEAPAGYGARSFPPGINPLTGLKVDDLALLDRRPILVKVTNFPRSVRPQWGLSLADHVYEYYIADSMTRFMGVFYSQDASRAGPVRSARLFDPVLARLYKGIFVFGWADDPVLEFILTPDLKPFVVVERPNNCPPICRIGKDKDYNNLFVDTQKLGPYLAERRTSNTHQDLSGLRFEEAVPPSGNPGDHLAIQYSVVSYHRWEFDPSSGRYLRFQETRTDGEKGKDYAPLVDQLTGEQLSAANVIVLKIRHDYFLKSSSTEIFSMPFIGRGSGYALRDGQIYPLTWIRRDAQDMPMLTLPNGRLYPLKPGNVWFEIVGETSTLALLPGGAWSIDFSIP
jgi:hypothetical protein